MTSNLEKSDGLVHYSVKNAAVFAKTIVKESHKFERSCHFFGSRCMLELKFAIYHRAASLPSQASYAVLAEESQAFLKHSPHTNSISNSAILRNNSISLLSDLCTCVHVKKKWRHKGSHSSVSGSNRLV